MSEVTIVEATEVNDELVEAFQRLTPVLSKSNPPPSADRLAEIVASPATQLLLALDGPSGRIVGTLTLALFRIPTGLRAWIEDVIADPAESGRGIGAGLTEAAIARSRDAGAITVDLTSSPRREAANHLYRKLGFQRRETNVYRKVLETE